LISTKNLVCHKVGVAGDSFNVVQGLLGVPRR